MPVVRGRGAGLGNELVPWARAYLMARELGAHCLHPAFGINQRRYGHHFGTSNADWLIHRGMAAALPHVRFDEADYLAHGGGDVSEAFSRFAKSNGLHDRGPLVVLTEGMWGGMHHIARAREFVRTTLYRSRYAAGNLSELSARLDPAKLTVAMHVRLGDFQESKAELQYYRGRFNCALPIDWFLNIGRRLLAEYGTRLQFQIFSDGSPEQLRPLVDLLHPVDTRSAAPADISDLLAMSQADLLVCSVSSYSVWAAMLSTAPYLWFEPQMHLHGDDMLSIWGHEKGQGLEASPTVLAVDMQRTLAPDHRHGRAFAIGMDDALDVHLTQTLNGRLRSHQRQGDLIQYGAVGPARQRQFD
ncbi:hypothetical protein [Roseateles sp. P5_E1]